MGAFLMILFAMVVGGASMATMFYNPRSATAGDEAQSELALASAKEALIGYAVRRGDATGTARPGELPCPDMNNDGLEEATCAAGQLGRIPWKTLGIPDPKDFAGETLWYAVAGPFRTRASNANAVNSNTKGNLVVRGADGVSLAASEAVAVLFAPGQSLGAQNRGTSVTACATGGSVAQNLCAANYLETTNGTNNAVTNGPFIAGRSSNTYNDRLAYVRTAEIIPTVEMRVGAELRALLLAYRTKSLCKCYPWADSWQYSGGIADVGLNRGRFPSRPYPEDWGDGAIPRLPEWVAANDWHNVTFYAAARQETDGAGTKCIFCSPSMTLTVSGEPTSAVMFTPGTPAAGINRMLAGNIDNMTLYLEDAANNNKAVCPGNNTENASTILNIAPLVAATCDVYAKPTATAIDRDRVFTVSTTAGSQCAPAARTLLENAPCKDNNSIIPGKVSAVCAAAVAQLATCSCAQVAQSLTVVPCLNTLSSSHCPAPVAQLQTCGT